MIRELITRPISAAVALLDLPRNLDRSIREANELMEISREQLELMRRQADEALVQAERMNDLLTRVVKLTEPIERAQRGGEYVGERLKRALFGEEEIAEGAARRAEAAALEAKAAAGEAEEAVEEAEEAAEDVGGR
ncbi:MAG: hypothetical protein ACRDL6_12815 [Solirubrobacterales bacterium]